MKLRVVLEPSEEGGYTAVVPSLPGCISEGDTREDALQNIREAIEFCPEPVDDDSYPHRNLMHSADPEVTVVIPVMNEAENIPGLAMEIAAALSSETWTWECVWVDDGSNDGTLDVLRQIHRDDVRQRFISFVLNAGQSAALWAGFKTAKGRVLATIDGDGQNDPADLPVLIGMVLSGQADLVNGYRRKRQDNLLRKLSSGVANAFRNRMTGKTVRDAGCSTRAFRREWVEYLSPFAGMHRFLPTLLEMHGARVAEVPVNHRPRRHGLSKYGVHNRLWVGLLDTFGVLWLRKRAFHFSIAETSLLMPDSEVFPATDIDEHLPPPTHRG